MTSCDLCGKTTECVQKEIDGQEFDVCVDCWHPLAEKLSSKGHVEDILKELEALQAQEEYEETLI
jgi:hypothetical protein